MQQVKIYHIDDKFAKVFGQISTFSSIVYSCSFCHIKPSFYCVNQDNNWAYLPKPITTNIVKQTVHRFFFYKSNIINTNVVLYCMIAYNFEKLMVQSNSVSEKQFFVQLDLC